MTSSIAKECGVCTYEFNEEERCPRLLPCFHSLCSSCIGDVIQTNDKKCPFCRQAFQHQRITDFRVNNNALELIKYVKDLESKVTQPGNGMDDLKRQLAALSLGSIMSCVMARTKIEATLKKNSELKSYLTISNEKIQEEVVSKSHQIIEGNKRQIQQLELADTVLQNHLLTLTGKQHKLEDTQQNMNSANSFSEAGVLMDNANTLNSHLKIDLDTLKNITADNENLFDGIDKVAESIEEKLSIANAMLCSFAELKERYVEDYLENITVRGTRNDQGEINVQSLSEMTDRTRALIQREGIYAAEQCLFRQRYAKISIIKHRYLAIHHLSNDHEVRNVHFLRYHEVMTLADNTPNLCFLVLKHKPSRRILGKIIIRLTDDTKKKAKNFQALCSGEKGPSYANTGILGVGDEGSIKERVWLGDYEFGDGRGGKSLIPGAGIEAGELLPWHAGAITAIHGVEGKASQVMIYTKERTGMKLKNVFGYVQEGLDVLTNSVVSYDMKNDVIISDCGIIPKTLN